MTNNTVLVRAPLPTFNVKGKGAEARTLAFEGIAPRSYSEGVSRQSSVEGLRTALGKAPTPGQLDTARREWIIGRVAARLAKADLGAGVEDNAGDRIVFARVVVTCYAAPVKDGTKAKKLRAGQTGRRTPSQHAAVRAAEQAWSMILAELGLNNAQTQKAADAKKKQARGTKSVTTNAGSPSPSSADIGKPATIKSAKGACDHIAMQMASLLAFCNKNAGVIPSGVGIAVKAAHSNINAAIKAAG